MAIYSMQVVARFLAKTCDSDGSETQASGAYLPFRCAGKDHLQDMKSLLRTKPNNISDTYLQCEAQLVQVMHSLEKSCTVAYRIQGLVEEMAARSMNQEAESCKAGSAPVVKAFTAPP